MSSPTPPRDARASALTTVTFTYVAALALGAIGALIGASLPCSGFLCNVGYGAIGGLVGVLASAPIAAWLAHRSGVRWWYTPIAYGVPVLALVVLLTAGAVVQSPGEVSLFVLAAAGPLIAITVAAPGRWWRRVAIIAVVAAATVLAPFAQDYLNRERWDDQRRAAIEAWRADGLPVFAPLGLAEVEVRAVSVTPASEHGAASALYDAVLPGVDGEVRVSVTREPNESGSCAEGGHLRDLGEGLEARGEGDDVSAVCLRVDGATVTVTEDGFTDTWRGDRLVEFARSLEPTDADWLEEHLREK